MTSKMAAGGLPSCKQKIGTGISPFPIGILGNTSSFRVHFFIALLIYRSAYRVPRDQAETVPPWLEPEVGSNPKHLSATWVEVDVFDVLFGVFQDKPVLCIELFGCPVFFVCGRAVGVLG